MNNYYNIDTNAHYFVPMRPRPISRILGFSFVVFTDNTEYFVECEVQPYDIKGIDHKCYLVPVDETYKHYFGKKEFYSCDFVHLLEKGCIIKKEHEDDHVEFVDMEEPICGKAVVRHQGQRIVRGA